MEMKYKRGWKPSREQLVKLRSKMTVKQIAELFGVSKSTVEPWITHYGIKYHECHYGQLVENLTDLQSDIIIGTMLGDASIPFCKIGNSSYHFSQSSKKKEYVKHIKEALQPFSRKLEFVKNKKPILKNGHIKHSSKEFCTSYRIRSVAHLIFSNIRKNWYPQFKKGAKKKIPKNLALNWRIVSYWFCDDGSNHINQRALYLSTEGFTKREVDCLIKKLKTDLNIKATRNLHQKKYKIRINVESYINFLTNIKPFVPWKCMAYKLKQYKLKEFIDSVN